MSHDVLVRTDVDNLVVWLTRENQLVITDYSVPILRGPLDRDYAFRLRPRMEHRDPRFNQLVAEQDRPSRDWPYVLAWVLMGMTLLLPQEEKPFLRELVLIVASTLTLVLALLRAYQIDKVREGTQPTDFIMSGEMLLAQAGLGTVVICAGLLALSWALGRILLWLPLGLEWFLGIALAVLVGATVALGKWIKQKVRGDG